MTVLEAAPATRAATKQLPLLKQAKKDFLSKLQKLGIEESELIVATMRKSRNGSPVGYYSRMSQFRSKARVVVDVEYIESCYISKLVAEEEVLKTIAHEYGHIMAEAIRHVNGLPEASGRFTVPDWKTEFGDDEEVFAEDFARFCVTYDAHHETFWDRFLPVYAADFSRLFLSHDAA
ncbi:hypothetical protein WJ97_11040 [Burkholderia ubonensis]|uniref:hypothetical protein n=1 Tax=Burkholderia ubonensis TaxID=101571 RepID=UPI0007578C07|nr:hypothetical protein [Burkholderia ubonensis]KVP96417.1 hypothetical protein WJ97_11040 [Burkholderia ubonensis]